MSHKQKAQLTISTQWAKHLRKYWKRRFYQSERKVAKQYCKKQAEENRHTGGFVVTI
jgi:hypothetical protein